jgi:putative permease
VIVSVVIAYLLQGAVLKLEQWRCPHVMAVSLVCVLGFGLVSVALFWLLPLVWQESRAFINELPTNVQRIQSYMNQLPHEYSHYISVAQIQQFVLVVKRELASFGKVMLSFSLASIPGFIELVVYAILVPLMVFFFLKDSRQILSWLSHFQPQQSRLVHQVRHEVNVQIGHYIRGKFLELLIVFVINALIFKWFHLNYAIVLAFFTGVSVLIPYIGVLLVSIPVVLVAYLQYGLQPDFAYLMIGYGIVMLLDGNVLVPVLFSETMAIHPVAIIVAIIFFGGLGGFWGVFFAIPLATVVKAVLDAWPSTPMTSRR